MESESVTSKDVAVSLFSFGLGFGMLGFSFFRGWILVQALMSAMLLGVMYWTNHVVVVPYMLDRKLTTTLRMADSVSLQVLKHEYEKLYHLYEDLPGRYQTRFTSRMAVVREKIEQYLVALKEVELLLQELGIGPLEEQREKYNQLHRYYRLLPYDAQKVFYTQMLLVKNRLERGA